MVRYDQLTKLYRSLRKGQPNALYAVEERTAHGKTAIVGVVITAGLAGVLLLTLQDMFSGLTIGF